MPLDDWQRSAFDVVVNENASKNILIEAPSKAGKTYTLEVISNHINSNIINGVLDDPGRIKQAAESSDTVLLDEAGAFSHVKELLEYFEEYEDVQFVCATVPETYSMNIVKTYVDIVIGNYEVDDIKK